jgi:tetratricopeptide (TPR) repeat protein
MSGGIPEYETVISLNPNFGSAYGNLGWCKFLTGSIEDVIPLEEKALRLTPRGPFVDTLYLRIGTAHLLQSHYEDAIGWLEKARNATLWPAEERSYLASAYALTGQNERAAAELAEARRMSPDDRYSSIARLRAVEHYGASKIRDLREATYFAGLRKAGMPEEYRNPPPCRDLGGRCRGLLTTDRRG